ncbi:cytochrome P450 2B11-like [Amblyomma americanum]
MWALLSCLCATATVVWLVLRYWLRHPCPPPGTRLAPMPPAQSIRGHVELYRKDFHRKKAIEWSELYGPVFRLRVDSTDILVLNDVERIRKFGSRSEILHRPDSALRCSYFYEGFATLNGDIWKANRNFCISTLRDIMFPDTSTEELIAVQFRKLEQLIRETKGQPVSTYLPILAFAANNTASLLFGSELADDADFVRWMIGVLTKIGAILFEGPPCVFVARPIQRFLERLPFTRTGRMRRAGQEFDDVMKQKIDIFKQKKEEDKQFIPNYINMIENEKQDEVPRFQYRLLVGTVRDIIMAGTFSTAARLQWHFLNFAAHPDTIQARIQTEIDAVVGPDRAPAWADRTRMPFTLACVWEMDRWKTAAPLGVVREASKDLIVDSLFIPKGTKIFFNFWAVHNDPTYWKDPHRFDPTRYFNDGESMASNKPQHLIGFSSGRRSCPGEAFATVEMFLLITFVLQKYRVLLDQPLRYDLDDPELTLAKLAYLKLQFLPRTSDEA